MTDQNQVSLYMRKIQLDVVVPERYVWEFMAEFGRFFATENIREGGKDIRSVDGYFDHPNGWHVQVSLFEEEETTFYTVFLPEFCRQRGLQR